MGKQLLTTFDRCIIAEPLALAQLKPAERETALRAQDPNTWAVLDRSQRNRLRNQYDKLTTRAVHPNTLLRPLLRGLIADKWHGLLSTNSDVLRRGQIHRTGEPAGECDVLRSGGVQRFTRSSIAVNCSVNTPAPNLDNGNKIVKKSGGLSDSPAPDSRHKLSESGVDYATNRPGNNARKSDTQKKNVCSVTGVSLPSAPGRRFVSATMLRSDDDLMMTLDNQHRQYAKGSKEEQYSRVAHNIRNRDSNPRNNLRRKINRLIEERKNSFFPDLPIRLTDAERALLDYWKGTPYEIRL